MNHLLSHHHHSICAENICVICEFNIIFVNINFYTKDNYSIKFKVENRKISIQKIENESIVVVT